MALSKPTGKLAFAHQSIAILEAARKQDEALIQQMLDVLSFLDSSDISLHQQGWHDLTKAIAAARARLTTTTKESPCSTK